MPYSLPHRKGYTIVHLHEEPQPCVIHAQYDEPFVCYYTPTLLTRLRKLVHRG